MDKYLFIQILLCLISLTGLLVYYYAFKLGYRNKKKGIISSRPQKLYFICTYPALIWYIVPFLKQPRMQGIYEFINGNYTIFNSTYIVITITIFLYFFLFWGNKSVTQNFLATKEKFYAPKKLLTDGLYARVRHPMIIGDIIAHSSLILFSGAVYTLVLFPIYIIIDICMIKIQIKYSLMPYFKEELITYRKTTPYMIDKKLMLVIFILILLLLTNILLTIS